MAGVVPLVRPLGSGWVVRFEHLAGISNIVIKLR